MNAKTSDKLNLSNKVKLLRSYLQYTKEGIIKINSKGIIEE